MGNKKQETNNLIAFINKKLLLMHKRNAELSKEIPSLIGYLNDTTNFILDGNYSNVKDHYSKLLEEEKK